MRFELENMGLYDVDSRQQRPKHTVRIRHTAKALFNCIFTEHVLHQPTEGKWGREAKRRVVVGA